MKITKRIPLIASMILLSIPALYSQIYEWQRPVQPGEVYKGIVTKKVQAGSAMYTEKCKIIDDDRKTFTIEYLYTILEKEAKEIYGNHIVLRQFKSIKNDRDDVLYHSSGKTSYWRAYDLSATVVVPAPTPTPATASVSTSPTIQEQSKPKVDPFTQAFNKALRNVREGSRLAIDQVSVPYSMDRIAFKDQIIDVLLDNGYKVVAKEQLEKLYQEQQDQQSGIYNDRTTVQENNLSAVGYFINIRLTESSVRVQVVNVSTGEYEGNATVNF